MVATGFRYVDLAVGAAIGAYIIKESLEILDQARATKEANS